MQFLFPLTAITASATPGFPPSAGVCTQWNPDRCHPTFPLLQTFFQQIRRQSTRFGTGPYYVRLAQGADHQQLSTEELWLCSAGGQGSPKSCRSSLAEVSTLLPAQMCEQKWGKSWMASTAPCGCIILIPAGHSMHPYERHCWQAPLTLSFSGK